MATPAENWAFKNPKLDQHDMRQQLVDAREAAERAVAIATENQRRVGNLHTAVDKRLAAIEAALTALATKEN